MDRQSDILLESGTNELGVMEFTIGGEIFGINVAKVLEIMMACPVVPMQKAQKDIEGIFKSRDMLLTVIDLASYLGLPPSQNPGRDIFIITRFNNANFAFHVHTVVGIDRISWTEIKKPDRIIYGGRDGVATGIAEYNCRLITILDCEKIVSEINPEMGIRYEDLDQLGVRHRSDKPLLIAEDSMLLSKMIVESLRRAGYENLTKVDNGQEAWDFLQEVKNSQDPLENHVCCVVTDIEMPQMDGHHLTKLIKEDPVLKKLPVILFSSLITEEMKIKGRQLGADAQMSKPEIAGLVSVIDGFVLGKK